MGQCYLLLAATPRRWTLIISKAYYLAAQPGYSASRVRMFRQLPQDSSLPQQNQAETANRRGCPQAQISIAPSPLPAVSFLGGFQTPAGPNKTCAHPAGRHLKPITTPDL